MPSSSDPTFMPCGLTSCRTTSHQPHVFRMSTFHYLDLTNLKFVKASRDVRLRTGREGLTVESLGVDPQIRLKDKLCNG